MFCSLIAGFLLGIVSLWGVDFHDFDAYQGCFTQEEIKSKIVTYLEKDPSIRAFYQITPEALLIGNDYALQLSPNPKPKLPKTNPSLKGARIALDPGHFGGEYAHLEERFVKSSTGETQIDEGTLTYLTALELKSLLEAEGAAVMITRSGIGQGVIECSFSEWLETQPSSTIEPSKLFRTFYNRLDLIARAKKINAFSPDISIIIHYNGHQSKEEKEQNIPFTHSNYSLMFIPGAFCAHELDTPEERYEFLRLILTDCIEQSLKLSEHIAPQFISHLKVPLIDPNENASYIQKASLPQSTGIYSRNLGLTRLVHGPLCYGETLVQNNLEEFEKLATCDTEIGGIPCSSRLKDVARAYFEGIKSYFAHEL